MKFTVIGASGFIGSALVAHLKAAGHEVYGPARGDADLFAGPLGHVIYAAGVTADFRSRPFDTHRAHVGLLAELLERAQFESLLYLSSARIYRHAEHTGEDAAIFVRSEDPEDFYDLTKLNGEALCWASGRGNVRAVRLTNVIGNDFASSNFLFDLIRSACDSGKIALRSALDSEKDYVLVEDIVRLLPEIALFGGQRSYNAGSGRNLKHVEIVTAIQKATDCELSVQPGAPRISMPAIDTRRVQSEFEFVAGDVLSRIPLLVYEYRKLGNAKN